MEVPVPVVEIEMVAPSLPRLATKLLLVPDLYVEVVCQPSCASSVV
jgi:hypothetical protein